MRVNHGAGWFAGCGLLLWATTVPAQLRIQPEQAPDAPDAAAEVTTAGALLGAITLPTVIVRPDPLMESDLRLRKLLERLPDPADGAAPAPAGAVETSVRFLLGQFAPQAARPREVSAEDEALGHALQGGCNVGGGLGCLTGNNP